jgi:hypothetical protein
MESMRLFERGSRPIEQRHKPHASNAANAACGSCFNLNTVCLDSPSASAMADRLGGLALSRA